jgi:hypothetical protein
MRFFGAGNDGKVGRSVTLGVVSVAKSHRVFALGYLRISVAAGVAAIGSALTAGHFWQNTPQK